MNSSGWYSNAQHEYICSPTVVIRYRLLPGYRPPEFCEKRVFGPLLYRTPTLRAGASLGLGEIREFCAVPSGEAGHSLLHTPHLPVRLRRAQVHGSPT